MHSLRASFILLAVVVILFLFARSIKIEYYPQSGEKAMLIKIEYENSFEQEVERLITNPVEEKISSIRGVRDVSSVSQPGEARININLFPEKELSDAYSEIREKVNSLHSTMPRGVRRPVIIKSGMNSRPVFIAAFEKSSLLTEDYIREAFQNLDGAGEVKAGGSRSEGIEVLFDPQKSSFMRVFPLSMLQTLRERHVTGSFTTEPNIPYIIDERFMSIEEIEELSISGNIRLGDVADVSFEEEERETIGRVNCKEKILVYLHKSGDGNTVRLCRDAVKLTEKLSGGTVLYNQGEKIEETIREIFIAISAGAALVCAITFFILRRFSLTLIVSGSIPFSILFTVAFLNIGGFPLNLMNLAGIAVGTGLVIDASVIYMEGYTSRSGDYLKPILFGSLTTAASFFPLIFAENTLIREFGEFALSVTLSLVASLLFVFIFMPPFLNMLNFHSLQKEGAETIKSPSPSLDMIRGFKETYLLLILLFIRKHRLIVSMFLILSISAGLWCTRFLNTKYENVSPADSLSVNLEFESGTPIDKVFEYGSEIENFIASRKDVKNVIARYEKEQANFYINLKEPKDREKLASGLSAEGAKLNRGFLHFPGDTEYRSSFRVLITGEDIFTLKELCRELTHRIYNFKGVEEVVFHFKEPLPSKYIILDLVKTANAGLNAKVLSENLFWAFSSPVALKWTDTSSLGKKGDDFQTGNKLSYAQRNVRLGMRGYDKVSLKEIKDFPVLLQTGETVLLKDIGIITERPRTGKIYHYNGQRALSFSVFSKPEDRRRLLEQTEKLLGSFTFPTGYRGEAGRAEKESEKVALSAFHALLLAAFLIFIILLSLFQIFIPALLIFIQIPFSSLLPLAGAIILKLPASTPVIMGLVLSAGLGVNNGILLLSSSGKKPPHILTLYASFHDKMKPMVLASLTTLTGILPLFFTGEIRTGVLGPLSLTIAFGVLGSLIFLPITLPIFASLESESLPSAQSS
ncbi:MAG: hypothetical protein DRP87_02315 [Spirochaetes bacterium]|nr:MAG: hypothetical protein DRP87_02315 [Spirochaetota bacterium]